MFGRSLVITIALCATPVLASTANPQPFVAFPEIEVVQPIERDSNGGCKNPHAEAWEKYGAGLAVVSRDNAEREDSGQSETRKPTSGLPAYLTETD